MDEEFYWYLFYGALYLTSICLFIGSLRTLKGRTSWATTLMLIGSGLILGGSSLLFLIMITSEFFYTASFNGIGSGIFAAVSSLLFGLLGPLLFIIGFFGFCARWGATGKRQAELLEITAALTAARDAQNRSTSSEPIS